MDSFATPLTNDEPRDTQRARCQLYRHLIREVSDNVDQLPDHHYQIVAHYYKKLRENRALRPFYEYNWSSRVMPMLQLLQSLPQRDQPWRLLDAGCGVGTEALLWAMVREDVQVLGVDVSEERLAAAKARMAGYATLVSHPLSVSFANEDVFDLLAREAFDVVWTMEAFSHIAPAESFLADVYANLPAGGSLLISDSHLGNPAMTWRLFKLRREGVTAHTEKTLASGKVISYAQERLFTVGQLSALLEQVGFRVAKVQLRIFFPPSFARYERLWRVSKQFDSWVGSMPFLRNLGGIYTIVARK